jgi:uncharacterized protein (DUF169 family)
MARAARSQEDEMARSAAEQEQQLRELLGLRSVPVAVSYRAEAPEGVPRVAAAGPSGCSYWRLAAEGQVFFTEAADHYNCPIGSYTHNIDLPPADARALQGLVETMVGLQYIRLEEVPQIPRRADTFGVAVYAPLGAAPLPPDVVLIRGSARPMMLLMEAASLAGVGTGSGLMGRPTCAVLPATLQSGDLNASVGCIGNRVYTGLGDDELYFAVPGKQVETILDSLAVIVHANQELEQFHRSRAAATAGPAMGGSTPPGGLRPLDGAP